ncbi:MAG: triple tyrosine motif-containing protein [Ferruginibacter sp.]
MGQNTIGFPDIRNFSKKEYGAGLQNWDIKQDSTGILYFANNEGLLCFNGNYWSLYPLPNRTIVRSIDIDKQNLLYAGGQDEMGFFQPNDNGTLIFNSLTHKIPIADRSFGDVWDILCVENSVFFRTTNRIFQYENGQFRVHRAPAEWTYLGLANNMIFAHDHLAGLMQLIGNEWVSLSIFRNQPNALDPVTAIIPHNGNNFLTTLKNGAYQLSGNSITGIKSADMLNIQTKRIFCATAVKKEQFAIGTNSDGLYVIDNQGDIIQHFSVKEGLQNNNVLSVFTDRRGNIWLGLDNGIDCISYNSAIKHIVTDEQKSSGYTARTFQNTLYIGTSSGLFATTLQKNEDLSFSKGVFAKIPGSEGQVWGLAQTGDQLYMGHHEGAFLIDGMKANSLVTGEGHWSFFSFDPFLPAGITVAGTYKGIRFYNGSKLQFSGSVPNFDESSRYLAVDQEKNIWVSHPSHGVFQITSGSDSAQKVPKYGVEQGLPKLLNNFVFNIKKQMLVATEKGVFRFNASNNRFEEDPFFKKVIGTMSIRYLKDDLDGNIWFIHEKKLGVIDLSGKEALVIYLTELDNRMLSGFEYIYPLNASNIFIGGEKGFYHINYEKYKNPPAGISVRLHRVLQFNQTDSVLYGGFGSFSTSADADNTPEIQYDWRNVRFEFASPDFGANNNIRFSYYLKGYDKTWSDWSVKTEKEYTNLPPGSYTFMVKAKSNLEQESAILAYSFVIRPPWYRTLYAYVIYGLITAGLLLLFYLYQRQKLKKQQVRHEAEQKQLQYLHELEMDKTASELITLRNEKLQSDLEFKNAELANSAMHLLQKGEMIANIKAGLTQLMKHVKDDESMQEIRKLIRTLTEDENIDKDWENFTQHFDKVHSDFLHILREIHPNITNNDMKLCSYLRMNLSSKEIARLLNISPRGVELSRYRLRKKMGLSTETNLVDYLMNIHRKPDHQKPDSGTEK